MARLWLCIVLSGTALMGACGPRDDPATKPVFVRTEIVIAQPRQSVIRLTGDVQARVRSELSFRVSGRITERLVDVGAHVIAGQIIARLDPIEQQADLKGAQAAVVAAEAQFKVATTNIERQRSLIASGFTTRVSFDQAQEALQTAEGSLEAAKAQLGTSRDALSYTELRASASGIITERHIEVGQVAQSAQPAYLLAEDGGRDAVFDVHEALFLAPLESEVARLTLVSDPLVTALARVREISPTVDAKTATVRVKFSIQDPPQAMTLGSAVSGEGATTPADSTVLPWTALTSGKNGPAVWVIDPRKRTVSLRDVIVDSYETNAFVAKAGLVVGDRVVTDGGKMLRPGQVVAFDETTP